MNATDDLHAPLSYGDIMVNALEQTPERPFLQLLGGPMLSVGEVRDATSQFVQALASLGVKRGVRMALISPNRPECLHIAHAAQLLAAVYVPMHPLSGLADHVHVIKDAGVEVLIFDAGRFSERAAAIAKECPELKLVGLGQSGVSKDLLEIAASFEPAPLRAEKVGPRDITRLGYSGGTTGKPKALPSVARTAVVTLQHLLSEWEWPNPPRIVTCAPLSHAGAAMSMPALMKGGTLLVMPGFEPAALMQAIQDYKINCTMLVPTMIYALLDHPRFGDFDLSSLETVFYGASAISPPRLKEAIEKIGPVFAQFYGQAEAPMCISYLRKDEHDVNDPRRLASCGRPSASIHLALLDGDNKPVADGEPGEICLRGPLVMDGYTDADLTAEAFRGGWHHTGDVAVRDPGGFLRIVDRTKDMIISGGFNVYPREIEDIIAEHPAVAQCAVIGVAHPKWGEAVTAIVVAREGASVTAEEITALVAARKGALHTPKTVLFVDAIPQTPVGKPDKKALRAKYAG